MGLGHQETVHADGVVCLKVHHVLWPLTHSKEHIAQSKPAFWDYSNGSLSRSTILTPLGDMLFKSPGPCHFFLNSTRDLLPNVFLTPPHWSWDFSSITCLLSYPFNCDVSHQKQKDSCIYDMFLARTNTFCKQFLTHFHRPTGLYRPEATFLHPPVVEKSGSASNMSVPLWC